MNNNDEEDRRENDFSFFDSVNREFGNANAVKGSVCTGGGGINDTVSRLNCLSTSEMNRHAGIFSGPDGNPCNPFIGDSYLFHNNSGATNETNNFGH